MDEYRALAVFVAVYDAGSFSGAGRRLKLSTSVVSHHISKLEASVGASLFSLHPVALFDARRKGYSAFCPRDGERSR